MIDDYNAFSYVKKLLNELKIYDVLNKLKLIKEGD